MGLMGLSSSHNIPNTNITVEDRIKALSTRPTSIDSFFSPDSWRFHNESCGKQEHETSLIVNRMESSNDVFSGDAFLHLGEVALRAGQSTSLASIQWPESSSTKLLERRRRYFLFRYIGLHPDCGPVIIITLALG
jgi:hypothetical protein